MSITVKCFLELPDGSQEIRRFSVAEGAITNYGYLKDAIIQAFGTLADKAIRTYWIDEEGDKVTFSSDNELMEALSFRSGDVLKVYVKVCGQIRSKPCQEGPSERVHRGVVCDACEGPVCGIRYKCSICPDYDLCEDCKGKGFHTEHEFTVIEKPAGRRWCGSGRHHRGHGHGGHGHGHGGHGRGGRCGGGFRGRGGFGGFGPEAWGQFQPDQLPAFMKNFADMFKPTDGEKSGENDKATSGGDESGPASQDAQGGQTNPLGGSQTHNFMQHLGEQMAAFMEPVSVEVRCDAPRGNVSCGEPSGNQSQRSSQQDSTGAPSSARAAPGDEGMHDEEETTLTPDNGRGSGEEWVDLTENRGGDMDTSEQGQQSSGPSHDASSQSLAASGSVGAGPSGPPSASSAPGAEAELSDIDKALNQLITMGFHDNEGWLTRVVVQNEGNMEKVMDEILKTRVTRSGN